MQINTPLFKAKPGPKPPRRNALRLIVALALVAAAAFAVWKFHKPVVAWFNLPQSVRPAKATNSLPVFARTNVAPSTNAVAIKPVTNAPPPKATNAPTASATNSIMSGRFAWPVLEAQLALDRQGFSPGSIDGQFGLQTRAALRAFQQRENLPVTGNLDAETKARLQLGATAVVPYTVTTNDLARLQPVSPTWLGKSQQSALDFENILELVAEKSHTHPLLVKRLNPNVNWTNVAAGAVIQLPNIAPPAFRSKAAWVTIHLAGKTLEAFDSNTNLLAHFPCSIAARVEKRPVGELHVIVAAANPNYTFDPDVFPESAEAKQLNTKLILPPGPNNPVGVAWIGLDRTGYGIHGTPKPEDVGRTESHGCFRLANWNAELLLKLVSLGTPVLVEE